VQITYRYLLPRGLRTWLRSLVVDCGMPDCRSFHLSHRWLSRFPGIFLYQTWYCSPACLREALKQRVEAQLAISITDLRTPPRMPFRLVLVAAGKVSEEQLTHARNLRAKGLGGEDVGDALVSLGYLAEDEVAVARAVEAGCLFYGGPVRRMIPDHELPLSLMRQFRAATVHYSKLTSRLLVGFVYRVDHSLLQAVEQVTGCRAEACIITASAWKKHMAELAEPAFEQIDEAAYSQGRIVGMIVDHAIGMGADKVRMGLCSTAIWARLSGSSATGAKSGLGSGSGNVSGGRDLVINLAAETASNPDLIAEEVRREAQRDENKIAPAAAIRTPRPVRPAEIPVFERRSAAL